jgi:iron only hydrogenase large subunit-like protein
LERFLVENLGAATLDKTEGDTNMKVYGATKYETAACAYGCCGGPLRKDITSGHRKDEARKAAKKRARRDGKKEISSVED